MADHSNAWVRVYLVVDAPTMYRSAVKKYPTMPFLGTRTVTKGVVGAYQFQTYQQVAARINAVASGLAAFSFAAGDRVGLYSVNRADWIIAEQACFAQNLCTVPLYDTLGTTHGGLAWAGPRSMRHRGSGWHTLFGCWLCLCVCGSV